MEKIKCVHDRYRWSNTLNEGICIDCMAKLLERPEPLSHSDKKDPNDVAYTMHQLQMLLNVLEEFDIQVKWKNDVWQIVVPEKLAPSQDNQQGAEEILKNAYEGRFGNKYKESNLYHTYEDVAVSAMQKYAKQERQRAIQECTEAVEKMRINAQSAPDNDYKAGYKKAITNFKAELLELKESLKN